MAADELAQSVSPLGRQASNLSHLGVEFVDDTSGGELSGGWRHNCKLLNGTPSVSWGTQTSRVQKWQLITIL